MKVVPQNKLIQLFHVVHANKAGNRAMLMAVSDLYECAIHLFAPV